MSTSGSGWTDQFRKIIKNRGHVPGDDAVIKLLRLAIYDITDKCARARAREKGPPSRNWSGTGQSGRDHLMAGTR